MSNKMIYIITRICNSIHVVKVIFWSTMLPLVLNLRKLIVSWSSQRFVKQFHAWYQTDMLWPLTPISSTNGFQNYIYKIIHTFNTYKSFSCILLVPHAFNIQYISHPFMHYIHKTFSFLLFPISIHMLRAVILTYGDFILFNLLFSFDGVTLYFTTKMTPQRNTCTHQINGNMVVKQLSIV